MEPARSYSESKETAGCDQAGARMAGGPHEAGGCGGDRRLRGQAHESRVARPEADHHDPAGHLPVLGTAGGWTCEDDQVP